MVIGDNSVNIQDGIMVLVQCYKNIVLDSLFLENKHLTVLIWFTAKHCS